MHVKLYSVDVVIPVYNGEPFIGDALASVASQTCPPRKIIVVNDGSRDGTERLVDAFSSTIPMERIKKANGGLSSARNTGIAHCDSDYIAFLDADDVWEPTKLEKQVACFTCSPLPLLGAVYCDAFKIDRKGRRVGDARSAGTLWRGRISEKLIASNCIAGSASSIMVKRECFERVGLFDASLPTCEDWDMWLRIAREYDYDCVEEPLVKIRVSPRSMSTHTERMVAGRILVLSKYLRSCPDDKKALAELRYQALRFLVWRKLGLFGQVLSPYPEREIMKRLFSNPVDLIPALWRGLSRAGRKMQAR